MRASVIETREASSCSSRALKIVVMDGLIYSEAHGIFLNQGSNPCLLHWQVDSLLLSYQGSPSYTSFNYLFIFSDYLTKILVIIF